MNGLVIGGDGKAYALPNVIGTDKADGKIVDTKATELPFFNGNFIGEDGKVYNLVDLLRGISKEWTLINSITTTEEVSAIAVTEDMEGNSYNFDEVKAIAITVGSPNNATALNVSGYINGKYILGISGAAPAAGGNMRVFIEAYGKPFLHTTFYGGETQATLSAARNNFAETVTGGINSIRLQTSGVFGIGTQVMVYVR